MTTTITQIPCIKVTITDFNSTSGKKETSSKICRQACVAAEFYAMIKTGYWWSKIGHTHTGSDRNDRYRSQSERRYRRSLKIFQKYLP